jgi:hypothetical protein
MLITRGPLCKKKAILREEKAHMISVLGRSTAMADRQQFFGTVKPDPELAKLLEASRNIPATEDELRAQRISFAFGNAPQGSENRITKESVKRASESIRLLP